MPSRNRVKEYVADSYYHIYGRGVNKAAIFLDSDDYAVFLNLLKRYLGKEEQKDQLGRLFKNYHDQMELLAFCLLPNHFHLLIHQYNPHVITALMRSLMISYAGYFNRKYDRVGPLLQDRFKASRIDNEAYLWHISRYIHLNPLDVGENWEQYPHSSYRYYTGEWNAGWVRPQRLLALHGGVEDYRAFVADYEDYKQVLDEIKYELAV